MAVFTTLNRGMRRLQGRQGGIRTAYLWIGLALLLAGCRPGPVVPAVETPWLIPATPVSTSTAEPAATATASPTPAPPPTATPIPPVRFAIIGDYGLAGDAELAVSDLVKSWQPDLILTTGDNNYPSGAAETIDQNVGQYYNEYIFPYVGEFGPGAEENRFFPSLGNHDWDTPNALPYLEYFSLPGNERYYDFTWGAVHFFALNSDSREPDGVGASSEQASWLRERLASSSSPWKIVYMHHPPYSSGFQGSVTWMRWPFKDWGADAVITGHDHTYERLLIDGLPYFINGLGGGARYPFEETLPGSQIRFRDEHGAMLVDATDLEIIFQFITRSGIEVDRFVLEKVSP